MFHAGFAIAVRLCDTPESPSMQSASNVPNCVIIRILLLKTCTGLDSRVEQSRESDVKHSPFSKICAIFTMLATKKVSAFFQFP